MRAVEILFEAEQRACTVDDALARRRQYTGQTIQDYTVSIVHGVKERQEILDEYLQTYAQGWTIDRMPAVDRVALRVGLWELLYNQDIPDAVAVSEAVRIVRELSTDDSPQFVNGLLGKIQEIRPTLIL